MSRRTWFDAEVCPNRSLSPKGLRRMLKAMALGGILAVAGLGFAGQWIAGIFLAVDLGLLAVALLACTRNLRAFERVRIEDGDIVVARHRPGAPPEVERLPAAWVRVVRVPHRQVEGLEAVQLTASGRTLAIAEALAPWERPAFADALESALARRRAGIALAA